MARRTLTNEQKRGLYKSYADGAKMTALVAEFGFSAPTLKKELMQAGIEQGLGISDAEIDFILGEGEFAPPAEPHPFGDGELAIIGETMVEKVNVLLEMVKTATTAEGVINALHTTLTVRQLMEALQNPPPLENWRDIEKAAKLLRDTFGMNNRSEKAASGIDYNLVNAKPAKGVILDI